MPRRVETPAPAEPKPPRKSKVRSAWISFAGRIVAQLVGAAATVAFALIVLQQGSPAPSTSPTAAPTTRATPVASPADGRATIAVLPFSIFAEEAKQNYIADAFTDLVVTDLAGAGEVSVVSSTSSMRYKGQSLALTDIASQLGVSYIVEGSLAITGRWARINAQLIDAATDKHIWARSYQRPIDDLLGPRGVLAADIAREVKATVIARR